MANLEIIMKWIINGEPLALILLGLFFGFIGLRATWKLINDVQEKREAVLKASLDIEGFSENTRYIVTESLERLAFYRAVGFSGDALMRRKLAEIVKHSNGKFSIYGVKRIKKYIEFKDSCIQINLGGYNKFDYYLNGLFTILQISFGLVLWVSVSFLHNAPLVEKIPLHFLALVSIISGMYSLWSFYTYKVAKKIKDSILPQTFCKKDDNPEVDNEVVGQDVISEVPVKEATVAM